MTAPAISVETVEDIDLTPVCGDECHGDSCPPATYWIEQHGCSRAYFCTPCKESAEAQFNAMVQPLGFVYCKVCGQNFARFEQAFTRVERVR